MDDLVAALGLAWNHRRPISRSPRRAAGSGVRFASYFSIKRITITVPKRPQHGDEITTYDTSQKNPISSFQQNKVIVVSYSYYHHTHYSCLIGGW